MLLYSIQVRICHATSTSARMRARLADSPTFMLALNRIATATCMRARTLRMHAPRCLCSLSTTSFTLHQTQAHAKSAESLCRTPDRGRKGVTGISTSSVGLLHACHRPSRPSVRTCVYQCTQPATFPQVAASAHSVPDEDRAMSKGTVLICLSGADHIRFKYALTTDVLSRTQMSNLRVTAEHKMASQRKPGFF